MYVCWLQDVSATTNRTDEVNHSPPIEKNQSVCRTSALPVSFEHSEEHMSETTFIEPATQKESLAHALDEKNTIITEEVSQQQTSSDILCTETDATKEESLFNNRTEGEIIINENNTVESNNRIDESTEVAETTDTTNIQNIEANNEVLRTKKINKKFKEVNIAKKTASDEQEDPLITKLDKKIERELRAIQGNNLNNEDEDEDDVDDETLSDLLHGLRAKELDEFLKS